MTSDLKEPPSRIDTILAVLVHNIRMRIYFRRNIDLRAARIAGHYIYSEKQLKDI